MKYWLLTTEYPPQYGGGISTYCLHTAKMLAENGFSVTVFVPDEKQKDYVVEDSNHIKIVRFNASRTGMQNHLGFAANLAFEFAAIVKEMIRVHGKPDCIESQEYLAIAYYLLQFRLLGYPEFENIPVIITLHSPAFLYLHYNREGSYSLPNYWTGEMEKSCIRCADGIIAPSRYIVEEVKKHMKVDDKKITVIRNPYPVDAAAQPATTITDEIVFFGKLSPQKGIFQMFGYMKAMWDDGFSRRLTVIGGTDKVYYPEMATMGKVISQKYAPYFKQALVSFTGRVAPEKKNDYLKNARVVLIPSSNDNLPYAAIEAMSIGKVTLVSAQGGQHELISDGINGFVFDHSQPDTFAAKLLHIFSLHPDELEKIGNAAKRTITDELCYRVVYEKKAAFVSEICGNYQVPAFFPFTTALPDVVAVQDSNEDKLLSIVVPFFNMGAYIAECIDSICASNYTVIEIIIVNDGSTSPESISKLAAFEKNPLVKVVHKENNGVAEARNFGAACANGKYLAFLDADDKVHPDYYRKAIAVLQQYNNVCFVGCWVQYFGTTGNIWPAWNPELPYILLHNTVNSSALVYKKSSFLKSGNFDKEVDYGIEDYESVVNMVSHGYGGVVLPECLFFYRVRNRSMYRELTQYKILYSYQYIAAKHPEIYSRFASEIFSVLNANGPSYLYDNPSFEINSGISNIYLKKMITRLKNIIKQYPFLKNLLLKALKIVKPR